MKRPPPPPILLTPQHVANRSGRSANAVLKAIRRGTLEATRIPAGKGWRYAITPEAAAQWTAHKTFDARGQPVTLPSAGSTASANRR